MAALAGPAGDGNQVNRPGRRPVVVPVESVLPFNGSVASFGPGVEDATAPKLVWVPPSPLMSLTGASVSPDGLSVFVPVSRDTRRPLETEKIDPGVAFKCVEKAFSVVAEGELGEGQMGLVLKGPSYKLSVTEPMAYKVGHSPLPPDKTLAHYLSRDALSPATSKFEILLREARLQQLLLETGTSTSRLPGDKVSGIPTIHDIREAVLPDGNRYLVIAMEYIPADTLDKEIGTLTRLDVGLEGLLLSFENVVQSVGQVNARGVVHRDIKPANIMGKLIIDFNLATMKGTASYSFTGTPAYAAPEQFPKAGRPCVASQLWDVYALGASLLHIVTGRPPSNENLAKDLKCDRALAAIIRKAMADNPEDRYQSAQELHADLVARRTRTHVAARREQFGRVGWTYGVYHAIKAHKLIAACALGLGILGVGTPSAINYFSNKRDAEREKLDSRKEKEGQTIADSETRIKQAESLMARGNFLGALNLLPEDRLDTLEQARATATSDFIAGRLEETKKRYLETRNDAQDVIALQDKTRELFRTFRDPIANKKGIPWDSRVRREALGVFLPGGEITPEAIDAMYGRLDRPDVTPAYRKLVLRTIRLLGCLAVIEKHEGLFRKSDDGPPAPVEARRAGETIALFRKLCRKDDLLAAMLDIQVVWMTREWVDDPELSEMPEYADRRNAAAEAFRRADTEDLLGRAFLATQFERPVGRIFDYQKQIQFVEVDNYGAAILQRWGAQAALRELPPTAELRERVEKLRQVADSSRLISSIDPDPENAKLALREYHQVCLGYLLLGPKDRLERVRNVISALYNIADRTFPDPARVDWESERRETWLAYLTGLADTLYPANNEILQTLLDRYVKKYPSDGAGIILRCETKTALNQKLSDQELAALLKCPDHDLHPSHYLRGALECLDLMRASKDPAIEKAMRRFLKRALEVEPRCRIVITDVMLPHFPDLRKRIEAAIQD